GSWSRVATPTDVDLPRAGLAGLEIWFCRPNVGLARCAVVRGRTKGGWEQGRCGAIGREGSELHPQENHRDRHEARRAAVDGAGGVRRVDYGGRAPRLAPESIRSDKLVVYPNAEFTCIDSVAHLIKGGAATLMTA